LHFYNTISKESKYIKCPYGQPGDKLWVRETWEPVPVETASIYENESRSEIKIRFKADTEDSFNRWHPSIHMPKASARIWLEITNVRVERLQEITDQDAYAEGAAKKGIHDNPAARFKILWYKINGKDSWNANPWVWVVEFKRIEPCQ
jgi:hypothetical protein